MRIISAIITAILFIPAITSAAAEKTAVSIEQLAGTWLSKEYSETLQATKDPKQAVEKVPDACSLRIFKADSGPANGRYVRTFIYNFHEGGDAPAILDLRPAGDDSFILVYGKEELAEGPEKTVKLTPMTSGEMVRIVSRAGNSVQEIEWSKKDFDENKKIEWRKAAFIKTGEDITRYVNRTVLAGKYKDSQGRSFVFTDKKAVWPGRAFNYAVQQDFAED
ncbi:MAG: hypothetical protein M0011_01465 [Elusimicrobia bacterium]|nr:hypothetical protein [Elusimicrobiota bacterium]